jgi:hypothetical protein
VRVREAERAARRLHAELSAALGSLEALVGDTTHLRLRRVA